MTDLPDVGAGVAFDQRLERLQAAVIDDVPDVARLGDSRMPPSEIERMPS